MADTAPILEKATALIDQVYVGLFCTVDAHSHPHARYMAAQLPDGVVREIPEAGHVSMVDNPGFVVNALREFLAASLAQRNGAPTASESGTQ